MTRKPILCLDFDGVIHSYTSGWQGADEIPDQPVPGAMHFIAAAVDHFTVQIFSARTNQIGGMEAMQEYMQKNLTTTFGIEKAKEVYNQIGWPVHKPPAMITLDDRAIQFTGQWPALSDLLNFKPWNMPTRM